MDTPSNIKLPGFLKKITLPIKKTDASTSNDANILTLEGPEKSYNPNSISSIFLKERQEASGITRVFRKSMTLMILQLFSFLILGYVSVNFFDNFLFNIAVLVLSISLTSIFYIIVADRSYVWISLLVQALLLTVVHSFLGLAFSLPTMILSLMILLFYYLAYSELEKVQLSSRIFSISHITGESTRILITGVIILIGLGVFNSISNSGSANFIDRVFFSNNILTDEILIGRSKSISVNEYLIKGNFYRDDLSTKIVVDIPTKAGVTTRQATFADFLEKNYEFSSVMTEKEKEDYKSLNCVDVGVDSASCTKKVNEEIATRLSNWNNKAYSNLGLELTTPLTLTNYRKITQQFYLNQVNSFEAEKQNDSFIDSSLLLVPLKSIIPAIFAILVVLLLMLFRFIIGWLVFFVNWFIWKMLLMFGFVQIAVETVEAEIVTI